MKNSIIWSKWHNVLGQSEDKPQYIPEEEVSKFDNFDPENTMSLDTEELTESNPVVVTPAGMIPLNPFNDPTKVFNFWMGETNFSLTEERVIILDKIPGVEVLDIFTRYRFRIAVGNNFKFQDVRQEIERAFDAYKDNKIGVINKSLSNDVKDRIRQMIALHLNDNRFWQVYVLPNEEIDFVATNDEWVFQSRSDLYKNARELVGGTIIRPGDKI